MNTKLAQPDPQSGWKLRVWRRKPHGKKSARLRIKCGCCHRSVDIWYDVWGLEINGVHASLAEWRKVLKPLLNPRQVVARNDTTITPRLTALLQNVRHRVKQLGLTEADISRIVKTVRRQMRGKPIGGRQSSRKQV